MKKGRVLKCSPSGRKMSCAVYSVTGDIDDEIGKVKVDGLRFVAIDGAGKVIATVKAGKAPVTVAPSYSDVNCKKTGSSMFCKVTVDDRQVPFG